MDVDEEASEREERFDVRNISFTEKDKGKAKEEKGDQEERS